MNLSGFYTSIASASFVLSIAFLALGLLIVDRTATTLTTLMEGDKNYRSANLSLMELSGKLGVPPLTVIGTSEFTLWEPF